ncbi:MAG: hypothetical protein ACXVB0_00140 [Mucilaginibacter sp.]
MPSVKVYGNKPDTGPRQLTAGTVRDAINTTHPTWGVAMVWSDDNTVYTSATASEDALESAVKAKLPGYQYLAY